jgi:hypothetical protein
MTDFPDRPGYSFDPGPPPEASRFLRNKGMRPAFSWADVEPEEHAIAFTVAKAMEIDVLEAIRGEVQKALDEGLTFATFQKNFRANPRLAEWWGKRAMVDPVTGELVEAQLGSPRRLRTIYNANLRSARAAGQWERIERTKASFPYLEYMLGPSEHHRPHHEDKAGTILPVDSPFWDEWMTPNGWGCKCWVRQITRREAERRGISAEPKVRDTVWTNPRTGEALIVPEGIDPGWQRNPGKQRSQAIEAILNGKLAALPPEIARVAARDIATSWRAARVLQGAAGGAVPVGVLPTAVAEQVGSPGTVVQMTDSYGTKFVSRDRDVTVEVLGVLEDALWTGQMAVEKTAQGSSLVVFSRGERPWRFVLKLLPERGEIWVQTIHRTKPGKWLSFTKRDGVTVVRE